MFTNWTFFTFTYVNGPNAGYKGATSSSSLKNRLYF